MQRVAPAGQKPQNRPLSNLNNWRFALRAMLPVKNCRPTSPVFGAPVGMIVLEFHQHLWRLPAYRSALFLGSVILHLAVLVNTDFVTDTVLAHGVAR